MRNKNSIYKGLLAFIMFAMIMIPTNYVNAIDEGNTNTNIHNKQKIKEGAKQDSQTKEQLSSNTPNMKSSNEIKTTQDLIDSIASSKQGTLLTINITDVIELNQEIVIPAGKVIQLTGNGGLKRITALNKNSHMLKIEEGATLFIDGITIDGNTIGDRTLNMERVASALEVLGNLTFSSGLMTQHTCHVLHVSGVNAKLTIAGGSIKNNTASSGVFVEDHAKFIMNDGEIVNNRFDNYTNLETNTILLRNGSSFEMNGGKIAKNLHSDMSGTIYVQGGRNGRNEDAASFTMNGGEISNNYSSNLSGGVTVGTWGDADYETVATFKMNGGTIKDNTSRYAGGGVLVIFNGDFQMNNGSIIGNRAPAGGGVAANDGFISAGAGDAGFDINDWGTIYKCPGSFTMNGGSISENSTNEPIVADNISGVGGGVYLASNMVTFNAGTISNNIAEDQGGGIYIASVPYQLQMYNTLITDNTASLLGGGIWTCPTGSVKILVNNGGALFDNYAQINGAGDDFVSVPRGSNYTTTLSERMLGAGKISYFRDGGVVTSGVLGQPDLTVPRFDAHKPGEPIKDISNSLEGFALKTQTTEHAKEMAKKEATVIVTGNTAKRGGGIGANGSVIIGTEDSVNHLTVKKEWNMLAGDIPTSILVDLIKTDNHNSTILETVELNASNNWTHKFSNLPSQYTYHVKEHKVIGFDVTYEKKQEGNTIQFIITNKQLATTRKVTKVWNDKDNQDGIRPNEIYVQLYANDKESGEIVKLKKEKDWSYTWSNLVKFADDKEIVYTIKEVSVPNGYSDKIEIDKAGNFTLINTHIVNEVPDVPEKPTKPDAPITETPKTGDVTNTGILLIGIAVSFGLLITSKRKIKKS